MKDIEPIRKKYKIMKKKKLHNWTIAHLRTCALPQLHNCTGTKWPGHRPCTCHQLPQVQGGETGRILPDDIYTDTILTDRQNMERQNAKRGNMNGQTIPLQVRLGNDNPTFVRIVTKLSSK